MVGRSARFDQGKDQGRSLAHEAGGRPSGSEAGFPDRGWFHVHREHWRTESSPSEDAPIEAAGAPEPATSEDDEFAAFRAASEKVEAEDAAAVASVPARKWTDADLSSLCNQAALKLGDPVPVKAIIAQFVPEGEVQHSRMIPDAKRAEFAAAIEAKAGIEFAG